MRTGIRMLLAMSLLSNAALVWLVAAGSAQGRVAVHDTEFVDGSAAIASYGRAPDDVTSKAGRLIQIERAALADARRKADRYWQAGGDYEVGYGEAVRFARDRVRDQLTEAFGTGVREDPLFRKYFRPMDPMFHFLSSDEQLAIEELKFQRDKRLQAAMSTGRPIPAETTQKIARSYDDELARVLDADRLFEYRLRESATAQQLRAGNVEFTESEFRDAHRLLARLSRDATDMRDVVEVRSALRDLLGSRRFAAVWSSRDPVYPRLKDLLAKNGVDEPSADAVYQVINDFQDRKMQAALQSERIPGAASAAPDRLADSERDAIARIVGERLADEVIRSRALDAFRMSRPPSQPAVTDLAEIF